MSFLPTVIYVVQRRFWQYFDDPWNVPTVSRETMKAFRSRDNAQLYCDELNSEDRDDEYYWDRPLRFVAESDNEHQNFQEIHDLNLERFSKQIFPLVGVALPDDLYEPSGEPYRMNDWWKSLTTEQQEKVIPHLQLFDNYTVAEIPTVGLHIRQG